MKASRNSTVRRDVQREKEEVEKSGLYPFFQVLTSSTSPSFFFLVPLIASPRIQLI